MNFKIGNKVYVTRKMANSPKIFLKKDEITEYLELTPNKEFTKPGTKFYVILNNIKHYIKEIFVITGTMTLPTITYYNGSSGGGWSPWSGAISTVENFGFIKSLSINITCTCSLGNFDYMGAEVIISNAKDSTKKITKSNIFGSGNNWGGTHSINIDLSAAELEKLGGADTQIKVNHSAHINRGSSGAEVLSTIKIITT